MARIELGEQVMDDTPIDPGAPFEHSLEEAVRDAKGDKDEDEPEHKAKPDPKVALLEQQLEELRNQNGQLKHDAEWWANFAKTNGARPAADEPDEVAEVEETPESLLDDMSTMGAAALAKRGYVKFSDVEKLVDQRINQTVEEVQSGQQFDNMLNDQFPELKDQNSDLFKRTQVHFRDMVRIDPAAKGSRVTLLASAKMAKAELAIEGKKNQDQEDDRRDRIDRQRSGGDRRPKETDGNQFRMSPEASKIVSNLSRFIGGKPGEQMGRVVQFAGEKAGKSTRTGTR